MEINLTLSKAKPMSVRLYVVTDAKAGISHLVCAQTRISAMDYLAKSVLMNLSAKPATPIDVLLSKKDGEAVLGEAADLAAIGI